MVWSFPLYIDARDAVFETTVTQTRDFLTYLAGFPSDYGCGYGPCAGALNADSPKSKKVTEKCDFLWDLHHIVHARSCKNFLWFPHTPRPPRPLKRPKNFNLFYLFFNFNFLGLLFRANLRYGYTSSAGASGESAIRRMLHDVIPIRRMLHNAIVSPPANTSNIPRRYYQ